MTMHPNTIFETAQRLRRPRYSARPFALTILAIALISLLSWAKTRVDANTAAHVPLRKRDAAILDEEVGLASTLGLHTRC